ncbi:MAG: SMC-Scp complex subunit ScpB [Magnetovibrio sp.]|nr:SMC-Scp complex subunit ScpB [Magnetovibrio sp.]
MTNRDTKQKASLDREAESAATNAAFDHLPDDQVDLDETCDDLDPEHLRLLEAVLFASSEPITQRNLALRLPEGINVKALLGALTVQYQERGIVLVRRGGSWAFRTAADLGPRLNLDVEVSRKLSRPAIETLAIIAYHQPVTRGEIEEIRGVSLSKGTLDLLFDEGWIKPRGHRDTPGRPLQWGTTDGFLDHFELESVSQLPGLKDLRAMGLLDARPALEAYSVRGDMQSSEDVQENMKFGEAQIEHVEHHVEDGPVMEPESHAAPLMPPTEPKSRPEIELDPSGATKSTANKLDEAMGAVAIAVKSAVKALEKDGDDEKES